MATRMTWPWRSAVTGAEPLSGERPNPAALVVGIAGVVALVALTVLGLLWTPHDPGLVDATARLRPMSWEYPLGTDKFGRDELSRLIVGARTTLLVGVIAVGLAAVIGVPIGIATAMACRRTAEIVMRANDVLLAFPALLLAIMLAAVYGSGTVTAMIAIGLASVPTFVRVTRSAALTVMSSDYVQAARVAGRGPLGIAVHHVLPNIIGIVIVQCSIAFAMAILAEAALSFLGLGTPPDTPSWGRMLQESQEMLYLSPTLALWPGLAIGLAVLSFNLLGDGLRDKLDPALREDR